MVLIQFEQRFPYQRQRVAQIGLVGGEQDVGVFVNDHQLDGGGAGIDADVDRAAVPAKRHAGHRGFQVPGVEFLVFLPAGEQRRQADVGGGGAVLLQTLRHGGQIKFLIGVIGRAQRHIQQAVFRAGSLDFQCIIEGFSQRLGEGQRPAQIQDIALDGPPLRKARDGLVHHRLIDGGGNVPRLCALIDERLDVAFGEHAAPAGDGVGAGGGLGRLVHFIGAHFQQGGHLVDERAGAAGTAAVHAHLGAVRQKQNLGVLAAQLDDAVGAGGQTVGRHAGGKHLLHKGNAAAVRQTHARRHGNRQPGPAVRQAPGRHAGEQLLALL